jgi:RNA polymerase sigma-70 factor (sigma-E family)
MVLGREGSTVEFSAFLDERQLALLRLAIVLCGSRAAAEDVLQEVLLRAFAQWSRIGGLDSPYGYVRKMLVNEHLSWRRRSARQLSRAVVEPEIASDPVERIAVRDDLLRRLAALPHRQRTAVILRYFEDLDDAEIARVMACAPVAVRSYVSRGLKALRVDASQQSETSLRRVPGEDLR